MHIDAIETYYVVLPLNKPLCFSHSTDTDVHTVIVKLTSNGHAGWGEASPLYAPTISAETASSVFFLASELFAPALYDHYIDSADQLLELLKPYRDNWLAKAAIESAWWSLSAAIADRPLFELLGGKSRSIPVSAHLRSQDLPNPDDLLAATQAVIDQGYRQLRLSVCHRLDLEPVRQIRAAFPELELNINCASAYSLDDIPLFKALDRLAPTMIEKPLSSYDLHDYAKLQSHLQTPLCLSHIVRTPRRLELALKLGSGRLLAINYAQVGGVASAIKLHDVAYNAGMDCKVSGYWESAIGNGIQLALATLPGFNLPADLTDSRRWFRQDLNEPGLRLGEGCTLTPSEMPGTPYPPSMDRLLRLTRQNAFD